MWTLENLIEHCNNCHTKINGKYIPVRPLYFNITGGFLNRIKWAWEVFRARADAFTWPEGQ